MTQAAPRNGFALLITLWMLVPLAVILLNLTASTKFDSQVASNLRDAAVLRAAADGGIYTGIAALVARSPLPEDARIGGADIRIVVEPLSGLVNPNLATADLLSALLAVVGVQPGTADALATAIVEWRSPGQARRTGTTKAQEYRNAGLDYGPPGAPFESLDELRDVLGMTSALLDALRPNLSLYGAGTPDIAFAPPPVRAAMARLGLRSRPTNAGNAFQITATASRPGLGTVSRRATVALTQGPHPWRVLQLIDTE